ncbi:MAG: ankyrin repeat domain-containing protein [Chloroflexota bacterium]
MPKERLVHALTSADQDLACLLIDRHPELIQAQFDDLSENGRKYYLVHIAAFTNQEQVLRTLIDYGADLNVPEPTHKGWTALHFCAQHRYSTIARLLCQHGADVSIKDRNGKGALDFAVESEHPEIVVIIQGKC